MVGGTKIRRKFESGDHWIACKGGNVGEGGKGGGGVGGAYSGSCQPPEEGSVGGVVCSQGVANPFGFQVRRVWRGESDSWQCHESDMACVCV